MSRCRDSGHRARISLRNFGELAPSIRGPSTDTIYVALAPGSVLSPTLKKEWDWVELRPQTFMKEPFRSLLMGRSPQRGSRPDPGRVHRGWQREAGLPRSLPPPETSHRTNLHHRFLPARSVNRDCRKDAHWRAGCETAERVISYFCLTRFVQCSAGSPQRCIRKIR